MSAGGEAAAVPGAAMDGSASCVVRAPASSGEDARAQPPSSPAIGSGAAMESAELELGEDGGWL